MAQNPDFYVTPTSGVLELVYAARANYTNSAEFKAQDAALMRTAFTGFCREGMKGFYDAITDKKYILDKSRGWGIHYDFLNMLYPHPKIICMVRDLRDVLCSMEKNFRKSQDKANPIVNHEKMQGTSVPKRVDMWMNSPPVGLAVERLADIIRQGIDKNMLFIRYEDLCLYPEKQMARIYEFFGIPAFTHCFDTIEQVTKEDDEVYGVFGDHKIRTKLELNPPDAGHVLGKDVCKWIKDTYAWYFQTFNYQ